MKIFVVGKKKKWVEKVEKEDAKEAREENLEELELAKAICTEINQEDPNEDPETKEQRLRREARSTRHLMLHDKKNPYCPTCRDVIVRQQQARRKDPAIKKDPEKFGDFILADHISLGKEDEISIDDDKCGFAVWDMGMGWRDSFGVNSKEATDAELAIKECAGTGELVSLYSDKSKELKKAAEDLGALHPTSTPYRPEAN